MQDLRQGISETTFYLGHKLFILAEFVRELTARKKLIKNALEISEYGGILRISELETNIIRARRLLSFLESVGQVSFMETQEIYILCDKLNNLIIESRKTDSATTKNINFNASPIYRGISGLTIQASKAIRQKININVKPTSDGNKYSGDSEYTNRQIKIADKIRITGNAAMRDLITEFPEVSERTLRYDLKKLCEMGFITRIGTSGPASHYIFNSMPA